MLKSTTLVRIACAGLLTIVAGLAHAQGYVVAHFGSGKFPNGLYVSGLSQRGQIVGMGFRNTVPVQLAFTVEPGSTRLKLLRDLVTAYGVNDAGVIVGSAPVDNTSGVPATFSGGVASALPGFASGNALAVNEQSYVVGAGSTANIVNQAFVTGPNMPVQWVGSFGGWSAATSLNSSLQIVGGSGRSADNGGGTHAFLYADGVMHDLLPTAHHSQAVKVNDHGAVVGFVREHADGPLRGFIHENGSTRLIDPLPRSTDCWAMSINNLGQVVGYCLGQGGRSGRAWRYDGTSVVDLSHLPEVLDAGLTRFEMATAINDRGQIAGRALRGTEFLALLLTPR